jgi:D-glycero-alpha-D-manno-heptose-7-phosphate kinase
MQNVLIRSKVPLRISFGGGGTDVSPYKDERGGAVLSATIDKYAYGTLKTIDERKLNVLSLDYDIMAKYHLDDDMKYDGELDLVKAVYKNLCGDDQQGCEFFIHSDAPPGSGLGSSSTMVVALIGLMVHLKKLPLTDYEIAELAYKVERIELGIKGGMQDQYAAVFGGFNFIEFGADRVIVNPLRIDRNTVNELQYHLLLCYTGRTRLSANIIDTQVGNYVKRDEDVMDAMEKIKESAIQLKNALLQNRLDDFGSLLHEAWMHKKRMAKQITNPHIDELYEIARKNGALGGKILGAGGGGYLLLYCEFDKKHIVARELEKLGGQVVEFTFESRGLQTWRVRQ